MKRTIVIAIDAALCAFLVAGCATKNPPQPQITPVMEVRHAAIQPDGYYQLGRFLQEQQRYDEAADAYRKALALDPNHVDALNGLGTLLALGGRFGEAHEAFDKALAQAPQNAAVLNNIGFAFLLEHKPVEAMAPLAEAARQDPGNARYRANLELASNNPPPASSKTPEAAVSATIDAVAATAQPGASPVVTTAVDEDAVRLVALGPHAFELVIPKERIATASLIALPTSHAGRLGLEVSNGNGASGMARRVGRQLQALGMPVARLTNNLPYGGTASQVEYRPGHEGSAADLSARIPGRPPLIASLTLRKGIDVRVVLGRDLPVNVALVAPGDQVAYYATSAPD